MSVREEYVCEVRVGIYTCTHTCIHHHPSHLNVIFSTFAMIRAAGYFLQKTGGLKSYRERMVVENREKNSGGGGEVVREREIHVGRCSVYTCALCV